MPLARHILVTISESLYTVYIHSNDEVINSGYDLSDHTVNLFILVVTE